MNRIETLVTKIGEKLKMDGETITCAESCTAGGLSYALTEISGSSKWFSHGFVTYSNQAKSDLLGVLPKSLDQFGAVSEVVVSEMALGALKAANANYALAVSGIAGPSGGSLEKPVGTVCFAWAMKNNLVTQIKKFDGDRAAVRKQSILHSLNVLLKILEDK